MMVTPIKVRGSYFQTPPTSEYLHPANRPAGYRGGLASTLDTCMTEGVGDSKLIGLFLLGGHSAAFDSFITIYRALRWQHQNLYRPMKRDSG
jgi:hypothetical protein